MCLTVRPLAEYAGVIPTACHEVMLGMTKEIKAWA